MYEGGSPHDLHYFLQTSKLSGEFSFKAFLALFGNSLAKNQSIEICEKKNQGLN